MKMKNLTPMLIIASSLSFIPLVNGQTGCEFKETDTNMIATCLPTQQQEVMLTGTVTPKLLSKESWFEQNYQNYNVDSQTLNHLKGLKNPTEINVIIGTWCSDCHRETPRFIKIIEALNNPNIRVNYIAVDRSKQDPQKLADNFEFSRIPTFIVMQNNKEIGRIVESPKVSLEKDLVSILN